MASFPPLMPLAAIEAAVASNPPFTRITFTAQVVVVVVAAAIFVRPSSFALRYSRTLTTAQHLVKRPAGKSR
jgi:hypothetical protein